MQVYTYGSTGAWLRKFWSEEEDICFTDLEEANPIGERVNPKEEFHILVSDVPLIRTAKEIETAVLQYGRVFIPIMVDYPFLTIGPLSMQGSEGCFHCYMDRLFQHDPNVKLTQGVYKHYEEGSNRGPVEIHPADNLLIMNWIELLRENPQTAMEQFRGKISRINLYNRTFVNSKVIGVHGCKLCGEPIEPESRSYIHMLKYLNEGVFAE
ncbi:hypothetical protein Q5741_16070 [Paenibacillus sp. JX-17]|uniref:Uncharacterized protein n=1 Tax=Paenibacillus lacisoli TaxID=3064525 RepID=A0ABT9CGB1_9BACL|nr:hypothetical protein [Paenibacillus sp. JX-17]MDO7907930.1 hypothetical protein [Paenibacillus sp. JX-17]